MRKYEKEEKEREVMRIEGEEEGKRGEDEMSLGVE